MGLPPGTDRTWADLARPGGRPRPERFDPDSLEALPSAAARWLGRVVPGGAPLADTVVLSMRGHIKIGRWMPFTADQILRAGVGFVWKPVVGGRLLRFIGADILARDHARMEFRLHGIIPVAKASGPDTARSAAGRLAAETVAWLPQATTPQAGARWTAIDDNHATVELLAAGEPVDVQIGVDAGGQLKTLSLQRWNDSSDPPGLRAFGGDVTNEFRTPDGVRVAGSGTVGWNYGTAGWNDGEFFRYTITGVGTVDSSERRVL